jgi:hypothetical protein
VTQQPLDTQWPLTPLPSARTEAIRAESILAEGIHARDASAAQQPGHDGPAITISIGHIEVRAPEHPVQPRRQAAQVPQRPRPSFRPRTTLADFLDEDTGRR